MRKKLRYNSCRSKEAGIRKSKGKTDTVNEGRKEHTSVDQPGEPCKPTVAN